MPKPEKHIEFTIKLPVSLVNNVMRSLSIVLCTLLIGTVPQVLPIDNPPVPVQTDS